VTRNPQISSRNFMKELPDKVRVLLPPFLKNLNWRVRGYLVQIYYADPTVHYEVWSIRKRNMMEIGLHMESRDRHLNDYLFRTLDEHIFEIRAQVDESLELERWDKGWAKLYRTTPLPPFNQQTLSDTATATAKLIRIIEPIVREALYARTLQSAAPSDTLDAGARQSDE